MVGDTPELAIFEDCVLNSVNAAMIIEKCVVSLPLTN